jgi:voltage-gated potassium channel Kch
MTAFYFTVTTITTVGYGDMSASTFLEQIICIFIMIAGVIGFSLASGALTNYISNQDSNSEEHDMRMAILDGLLDDFDIEHSLYAAIRNNIANCEVSEAAARSNFIAELPADLREPLTKLIY